MTDKITLDEIVLDTVHLINALPEGLYEVQRTARIHLLILAAITRSQFALPLPPRPRWRHKILGSVVTEIARGRAQCSTAPIREMAPVVIYLHDDEWWVRHVDEFDDGRFESVP